MKVKGDIREDITVICPTKGWKFINFKELWEYRELIYFLTWRDIKVRYKQTLIGILWAILQPVITMVVFSVFFGNFAEIPSEGIPYPIFVYTGLLIWMYFSQSISRTTESIVSQSNLIKKVYFPRIIIPLSSTLIGLVDFLIEFIILLVMMVYFNIYPKYTIILLPVLIIFTFLITSGVSIWLSSLNVIFRDVKYIVPFLIRIGLFLTPVIYPAKIVPDKYGWLLYLNPLTGLIESYRAIMLGYKSIPVYGLIASCFLTIIIFLGGALFFKKIEKLFVDLV